MTVAELIEIRKASEPSSGEKIVMGYLKGKCISFKREFYCYGLRNDKTGFPLFFDFYVNSLKLVIEVDGIQHFKAINGQEEFYSQIHRDKIKDKFCKDKGLTMLRLDYSELKSPFKKLKKCLQNCLHNRKIVDGKKGLKKIKIKSKPEKKRYIPKPEKNMSRLIVKNREFEVELNNKRDAARLKYPIDVRIYLAEKEISNVKEEND